MRSMHSASSTSSPAQTNRWLVLVIVCLAQFMVILDATIVNVALGIAALALALRYVPESHAENRPDSVDIAGAATVTGGLVTLVYAIVKAQEFGWTSGRTLGLAAVAVSLLSAFVWIESRSKAPLIRLSIFRNRSLTGANVT